MKALTVLRGLGWGTIMLAWTIQLGWAEPDHGGFREHGHGHCHGHELMTHHACAGDHLHHLLKHKKELGLTDEQVTKLRAIDLDLDRARIKGEAEVGVAER